MIKRIEIKNFKCFSDIEFELGNVNLLAGSNGWKILFVSQTSWKSLSWILG